MGHAYGHLVLQLVKNLRMFIVKIMTWKGFTYSLLSEVHKLPRIYYTIPVTMASADQAAFQHLSELKLT